MRYPSDLWADNQVNVDVGDTLTLSGNVTLSDPKTFIGCVSVAHAAWADPKTFIGLATVNVGSIAAGTNYIGSATVQVASIAAGTNYIGSATVQVAGLGVLISGEDQTNDVLKTEHQFTNATYNSNSTSAVKSASGLLHSVTIANISCPTISLWDNTVPSGTLIHRFHPDSPRQTYTFDSKFTTGLTIDVLPGVAPQVQISYR